MAKNTSAKTKCELPPDDIDELVLSEYPYPIAANYRKMLDVENWEQRTRECIKVFDYSVRAITLGLLSQYLIRDGEKVNDPELNKILFQKKFRDLCLGDWIEYLFLTIKAYGEKQDLFFIRELYSLYWDTAQTPHRKREEGIRSPFKFLVELRNDLAHNREPRGKKEWEEQGLKALENLRQVMKYFSFLQNYDLIQIASLQDDTYDYACFTGQMITHQRGKLKSKDKLRSGWFYLCRHDHAVLGLHPLLIFWNSNEDKDWTEDVEGQDVAVFQRLLANAAEYLATVIGGVFKPDDFTLISELRNLIYNLEHVKMGRQRVTLSWDSVRGAVREVTAEQMGSAYKKKYNKALYLQREAIFKKFQDFLDSDRSCFILTGKSGVGKSNFVLSLADAFVGDEQMAVLVYNAARLEVLGTVVQTISQDLGKLIRLEDKSLVNVFSELEKNEEMTGKKVLVIFDAINENTNPREALQKINQMVWKERYPWLKILITSRPEGWRAMKRGVPLAEECYYREPGSEEVTFELEEFTVKMEPFEREELREAYEKYKQFFNLQTEYSALRPAIRNVLRDPLVLRLVAEINKDKPIPEHIQVNDIYWLYVKALLGTQRLYQQDVDLLEQELMPLMLKPGSYDNRLSSSQIQMVRTRDGCPLWELLHNEDSFSTGQRVNDSYIRLLGAEILDESGSGLDYIIGFKYERFYEFFGGRRLYQAAKDVPDRVGFYTNVADHLNKKVFLWGALVQALVLELKDGTPFIMGILAENAKNNRLLRSALVEALVRFGEGDQARVEGFIGALVGQLAPPPRTIFGELWRLLQPIKDDFSHPQPKKMVAVEAAARLRMTALLEDALVQPSPWLRNLAAQNTFYLWKQDHQAGLKVLDGLSYRVRGKHGLPNMSAAESMLALTGVILGFEHKDPAILESLAAIGRRALRRILYLTESDKADTIFSRVRRVLIGLLYNLVTGAILKFVLSTISGFGKHTWASLEGINHFYKLSADQKQLVQSFIPMIDFDEPGLEKRVADMITIEEGGDQLSDTIVQFSILGHGVKDFDGTLAIVKEMMEYGLSYHPPRFWTSGTYWSLWQSATHLKNPNPGLLTLVDETTRAIQEDPEAWLKQASQDRPVPVSSDSRASTIAPCLGAHYTYTNQAEVPELVQKYLDQAIRDNDEEYLEAYLSIELAILFEMGNHRLAVTGLKPLANYKSESIRQAIVDLLVRARNYDPEYIEDLLLRDEFPQEIVDRVFASPTVERLTDLLTYQLIKIVYDLFILGPKSLRYELKWLMSKGIELSSFQDFIVLIIREILNVVLGEVVFKVPKDAPSRNIGR